MRTALSLLILFSSSICFADTAKDFYQRGLGHFQNRDWQAAAEEWDQALKLEPNNPIVLFNLGLARFRLGESGIAVAFWRKASSIDPSMTGTQLALTEAAKKLGLQEQRKNWWVLSAASLQMRSWYMLSLLFFTLTGWLLITFFSQRRTAFAEETPLPKFPYALLATGLFFVLFFVLGATKYFDQSRNLGTIISSGAMAKSSPGKEGTDLFKVPEGTEVTLKQVSGEWAQAFLPGGLSGWVKRDVLFQTSGAPLW